MKRSIDRRWTEVKIGDAASRLMWTPCDVVTRWFEADQISLRLLPEMEADAMAAMIDQTRWNGAGARFCSIIHQNGQQRLVFAGIQEDGQAFSVRLNEPLRQMSDLNGPAPARASEKLPHPRGQ